jgi:hypothetical protein
MKPEAKTLPKAEVVETPTQTLIKERNPIRTVVDELGRTIRYRRLSVLERARMSRALGEHATNVAYAGDIGIAACVIDIDGDIGPAKTTLNHLEGRLAWLGDEGYEAVLMDHRNRMLEEESEDSKSDDQG